MRKQIGSGLRCQQKQDFLRFLTFGSPTKTKCSECYTNMEAKRQKDNKKESKRSQQGANGSEKGAKASQGEQKGNQKGANGRQKGTKRRPKGIQESA